MPLIYFHKIIGEDRMKKSYKRMLIFQFFLFLILIFNSFVSSILTKYNLILFLIIVLAMFKVFFGFEKDRHRYVKDVIFEIVIFLLIYFILFYLLGIIIGFAKTDNYYSFSGFKDFIIPLILSIILKEFLRYMMLTKSEGSKILNVTTVLFFIALDISNAIYYSSFANGYDAFVFVALYFLPAISSNIACSYITMKTGYKPVIVYLLVTNLYQYLLPIIPDPNEYILSIINLMLPLLLAYNLYRFFQKDKDEELKRDYKKRRISSLIPAVLIAMIAVYFTSGYFSYYAVAIASGSMVPSINKGDVVIVKKIDNQYDQLEEGQVIAFKYNEVIVVHRLINIIEENGQYYFYTKGDANSEPDNYVIHENMIIGTVNLRIPYLGLPTVWLNEL